MATKRSGWFGERQRHREAALKRGKTKVKKHKRSIVIVPAKSIEGARKQWKKEVNPKYWKLIKVRLAKPSEYPYKRTRGYKSYALIVENRIY